MCLHRGSMTCALFVSTVWAIPVLGQPSPFVPSANAVRDNSSSLSAAWQQTLQSFDDWGRVQEIYTPPQLAEMRQKMVEKAYRLAPDESESFRGDINAKLHILMSAEAGEARRWLTNTLAVASDSYAQKVRAQLPDVVTESPRQLQADLDAFAARQANVKQYQQGLEQTRQMAIKAIEADTRRQADANAQAYVGQTYNPYPSAAPIGGSAAYQRYRSPYTPAAPILPFGYRFW